MSDLSYEKYPAASGVAERGVRVELLKGANEDALFANAPVFAGASACNGGYTAPCSSENAVILGQLFPYVRPCRVLRAERSFGVGDRLGIAADGHIRVFEKYDAAPVLAQQSMRELELTHRRAEDVLAAAAYGVFRNGWTRGYGADGDHLKRPQDVEMCLRLGYTMITLDLSDHIHAGASVLTEPETDEIYLNRAFDCGEGLVLRFSREELAACRGVYGEAIGFACELWNRCFASKSEADVEISIDETATPTTPAQHFFVANELRRRGVGFATIAPRFIGEFQKGIDYIGDVGRFAAEAEAHAVIARHFGYKLSIHSGSDKFSVFPAIGRATREHVHVKTAGTNWLEAMRVVAETSPALYRRAHEFALASFNAATKYYHVTTNLANVPPLASLADSELPLLFKNPDARQLIHITYGQILSEPSLAAPLYALWRANASLYADALEAHIGRHMQSLGFPQR